MVGVAGHQGPGSVELFGEDHANQGVRQSEAGELEGFVGFGLESCIQTIRAADDEARAAPTFLPGLHALGQSAGGEVFAMLIQHNSQGLGW